MRCGRQSEKPGCYIISYRSGTAASNSISIRLSMLVLPIGEGCASTAWVAAFCMQHNWLLAQFPEAAQDEVFSQFPYITAPATQFPPGKAEAVKAAFARAGGGRGVPGSCTPIGSSWVG